MRFGLFGSATARHGGPDVDSGQGYKQFVEYNIEAEALGYHSTFLVEHHFTGFGQVSAENLLREIEESKELPFGLVLYALGLPGIGYVNAQALAVAKRSAQLEAIHRTHHPLHFSIFVWLGDHYEIYFTFHQKILADVIVSRSGRLGPTYTGPLILGVYARGGYGGAFFDTPWVLVPFTAMFLLGLAVLRTRSWVDLADLGAVLSFGVSYALFDTAHLEAGVWLAYPPLLYLLVRMLVRGMRGSRTGSLPEPRVGTRWLALAVLALAGGRIALTLLPPQVMDVGVASALGATRILHGQSLYFPSLGHPDTYGPVAYLAYTPFVAIWPGVSWGYMTSARAAAITFDLATIVALIVLGTRLRPGPAGRRLGLLMAWLWAACPFTLLGMVKSTNDGLVALLVILGLLALTAPFTRGVLVGLAAAAKFFPAALLALLAVGPGEQPRGAWRKTVAGFVIAAGTVVAVFLPPGGLRELACVAPLSLDCLPQV